MVFVEVLVMMFSMVSFIVIFVAVVVVYFMVMIMMIVWNDFHILDKLNVFVICSPVWWMYSPETTMTLLQGKSFLLEIMSLTLLKLNLCSQLCFFLFHLVVFLCGVEWILESFIVMRFMFPVMELIWAHVHQLFFKVSFVRKWLLVSIFISFFV